MTNLEALKILKQTEVVPQIHADDFGKWNEAFLKALEALEQLEHLPCYLDGPCEYQNKDIIVPSCSWCKHCNSEGVCAYWGTARVCEDTTPCSHYELDKQFFKEERTNER